MNIKTVLKSIPVTNIFYDLFKNTWIIIKKYPSFIKDFKLFKANSAQKNLILPVWSEREAMLFNNTKDTNFSPHYIYHSGWAARVLAKTKPDKHIDISSTLYFSSIISAFLPVEFYDYRPANLIMSNLKSSQADLCDLYFDDNSIESLSCMHTVEHVGLGRYGDPVDPEGDKKAINELIRVLAPGGSLIFVVPVGKPRIIFNAHRIYSYEQVISHFSELELKEFSLIPDNGKEVGIIKNASQSMVDKQNFACGLFWFVK